MTDPTFITTTPTPGQDAQRLMKKSSVVTALTWARRGFYLILLYFNFASVSLGTRQTKLENKGQRKCESLKITVQKQSQGEQFESRAREEENSSEAEPGRRTVQKQSQGGREQLKNRVKEEE
ncbi:hypothetical protein E2C01_061473 [Portunus trituberculatus]|uniref:Uncharacterized protein n=1 Tax=Portunus trituberculatus TaxID=210409 RepID=A0A5B7H5B6_PORTR|nr:hypothetical protein [Portunus trituberculatus]